MDDSRDRRAGPRRCVTMACLFETPLAAGQGLVTNLSQEGAFVKTSDCPPRGASADLTLRLSPGVETRVAARVVHTISPRERPELSPGFGLRFLRFGPGERRRLEELLETERSRFVLWSSPPAERGCPAPIAR